MSDGAKDSTSKEDVGPRGVQAEPSASTVTAGSPNNSNGPTQGAVVKTIGQNPGQVAAMSPSGSSQGATNLIATDPATQFRSTLALGQLITAKTPSAGSRIVAGELRQLSNTLKQEGAALRKEISSLHTRLADSLKVVLEEDREQRNASGVGAMGRRPVQFGSFPYRRFPVYRIPRRVSLAFARKTAAANAAGASSPPRGNASGAGVSNPTAAAAAVAAAMKSAAAAIAADASSVSPASSPENNNNNISRPQDMTASKEVATKSTPTAGGRQNQSTQTRAMKSPHGAPNRGGTVFKNPWFSRDRSSSSYDGEADTDSEED